jgi:hypothetical protein
VLLEDRVRPQREEIGEVVVQDQMIQQVPGVLQPPIARTTEAFQFLVTDRRVTLDRQDPAGPPQPQL